MKLLVGLGNPGVQYEKTRHNAGFIVLEELCKNLGAADFQANKKFAAEICEVNSGGEKIILAKPQQFMNLSGQAVKKILDFYKIPLENLTLIHDDLDIELGKFKVSTDSSAAGHNGVQSVFDELGTQKIRRLRIGIEGAEKKKDRLMAGSDFVLQNFSAEEIEIIKNLVPEIAKAI